MREQLPDKWSKFIMKDVSFVNLMMRRIYNVLIVANPYDAFMLEDDGRVEEKIYNEYTRLGPALSVPRLRRFLRSRRQRRYLVRSA